MEGLRALDAINVLRSFFLLASCTVLAINALPALRGRFVAYGARTTSVTEAQPSNPGGRKNRKEPPDGSAGTTDRVLDYLAGWRVPHGYFLHFYITSVISSLFWATEIWRRGPVFSALASQTNTSRHRSMSSNQVVLCWALMAAQGGRRLWESITLAKPSQSKMWFVHWLLGIGFYIAMGISIWIEGTSTLMETRQATPNTPSNLIGVFHVRPPSLRTFICLPIFLIASGIQHDCHSYLASLQKYTLPTHPAFIRVICPHYTAEWAIYASLTIIAAPEGEWLNKTMLTALVFVVINLGVSAQTSKEWYERKFGKELLQGKWRMIPLVY